MPISTAARFGGVSLAAALLVGLGVAWADSPHFVSATDTLQSDGDLLFQWKEAGLGSAVTVDYTASADAQATCFCVTSSGNCPSAANKTTTSGVVSASGSFTSTKAGNINGSLTVQPPSCPSSAPPTCPGGQTLKLGDVVYSDITLLDTTNNINANISPTSASATFFTCPSKK